MPNRYANLVGSNKIKDEWQKINTGFDLVQQDVDKLQDEVEYIDDRVDQIISDPTPGKDPELVDIRTVDPSYTPQRTINAAGDVTRDMQAQFAAHKADYDQYVDDIASLGIGVDVNPRVADDLNDEVNTGWVRVDWGVTLNAPSSFAWGLCRIDRRVANALYQTAYRTDTNRIRIFVRKFNAGFWTDWSEYITDTILMSGTGSPEGSVVATPGTLYRRTDTGQLWVKKTGTGNTGWGQVTVS